jgi:guanosine-3',5'-bis(diphosphate) 3'-pyrophosphohydrolase
VEGKNLMLIDEAIPGDVLRALVFAAGCHSNQRRKDSSRSPYINHLLEVVNLLWNTGGVRDRATLIAAALHDTIEDTGTRPDEIEETFGRAVRDLVMEVTDDKSLAKEERKRLQIEHAAGISDGAKAIKLADKISNVRDVRMHPPEDWSEDRRRNYIHWAQAVVARIRGTNPALEAEFDRVTEDA